MKIGQTWAQTSTGIHDVRIFENCHKECSLLLNTPFAACQKRGTFYGANTITTGRFHRSLDDQSDMGRPCVFLGSTRELTEHKIHPEYQASSQTGYHLDPWLGKYPW
jgi:hypothetical protein